MSKDLFAGAPQANGHAYLKSDPFRWIVGMFKENGAQQAIIRANKCDLLTYYPIRFNGKGEPVPLWRNYLFMEYRRFVTLELFHKVPNFIKVITERDDDGLVRPVLVRRNGIEESMKLVMMGRFNARSLKRRFYGKGSIVRVLDGGFIDKKVKLEVDVRPDMNGRTRVTVDINGIKARIEIFKLALL
jgi:hypothetical protein